jgi:hypothetical protein
MKNVGLVGLNPLQAVGRTIADDGIGSSVSRGRTRFSGVSYPITLRPPVISFTGGQILP